jgi:hypothetical protein
MEGVAIVSRPRAGLLLLLAVALLGGGLLAALTRGGWWREAQMTPFRGSVVIRRPPEVIFEVMANLHRVPQAEGSPVLALDLATSGPVGPGSRFREVVRILPFYSWEFLSEITTYTPPRLLEETFTGPGMSGLIRYDLTEVDEGTELVQQEWLSLRGLLRVFDPMVRRALYSRLEARLDLIKRGLEEGTELAPAESQPIQP